MTTPEGAAMLAPRWETPAGGDLTTRYARLAREVARSNRIRIRFAGRERSGLGLSIENGVKIAGGGRSGRWRGSGEISIRSGVRLGVGLGTGLKLPYCVPAQPGEIFFLNLCAPGD